MEFDINIIFIAVQNNWVSILILLVLFFLGKIILRTIIKRAVKLTDDGNDEYDSKREQQAETLGSILLTTGNVAIYVIVLLMALDLFGVDITPILGGAAIIGLAVGFGSQELVKDFVSGIFILIEHQYSIGDIVKLGDFEGEVVRISIRSTVLKNKEGQVFYISNGTIKKVINDSQQELDWK